MSPEEKTKVREIMWCYALADSGDEVGAKEHRFKAVSIDPAKGSAAGYIAKYIAKNIDGYKLEKDLYGNDSIEAAERITAWANASGIRQFQQIGGPSVTVWRQLRKLDKTDDEELESIRQMATASDWAAFMLTMGGYEIPRKDRPIKPFYDYRRKLDIKTGEIIVNDKDCYGGNAIKQTAGLTWKNENYDTRKHFWQIVRLDSEAAGRGEQATTTKLSDFDDSEFYETG